MQNNIRPGYEWVDALNGNIYYALFLKWGNDDLPAGYDLYIVSYHLEAVDLKWLRKQSKLVDSPIIVLNDGSHYDVQIPSVTFLPFYYWHYQLDHMIGQYGVSFNKNIKYKASAFSHHVIQSKLYIFTALAKYLEEKDRLIALSDWVDVDDYSMFTGNQILDDLYDEFNNKWSGKTLNLDLLTSPDQPAYQECAVHFTNESFHYSFMMDRHIPYTYPGPFLTEKTLKCLLGATGFVPVGQFETYKTLESIGFKFNYEFNTDFDNDPGNMSRLAATVELIQQFADMDAQEIFRATQESSEYNQQQIVNGTIYKNCEAVNAATVDRIHDLLR